MHGVFFTQTAEKYKHKYDCDGLVANKTVAIVYQRFIHRCEGYIHVWQFRKVAAELNFPRRSARKTGFFFLAFRAFSPPGKVEKNPAEVKMAILLNLSIAYYPPRIPEEFLLLTGVVVLAFATDKNVQIPPIFHQFWSDLNFETGFREKSPTAHLAVLFYLVGLFVLAGI